MSSGMVSRYFRPWLLLLFTLFAVLTVNGLYLAGVTLAEWLTGQNLQDYFYLLNVLLHLAAGVLLLIPFALFLPLHLRMAGHHPNRRARQMGKWLAAVGALVILSGLVLTRFELFEIKHPYLRQPAYWLHVVTPLLIVGLFLLHRKAAGPIRWQRSGKWLLLTGAFVAVLWGLQLYHRPPAPELTEARPFAPALTRIAGAKRIPAERLMMDRYCRECHEDIHQGWLQSVHRLSSFNNPAYRKVAEDVRALLSQRDGNPRRFNFCAGCHDLAPMLSGKLAEPGFDLRNDPSGKAGITCSGCHAITAIGSTRGNGDYVIEPPRHYPFTDSDNPLLQWLNRQLIKAKPAFHNRTFLKPIHKEAEFCSVCHKVAVPREINGYKWLRGQDHYDAYLLSGVSGHGVTSFYYPARAVDNCAQCHMPLRISDDFGARPLAEGGQLAIHDHQFAAANTAVPHLAGLSAAPVKARERFLGGALRVDLFGIREEEIDGRLHAPLRPALPVLEPGNSYLIETVVRTLKVGHTFTQGTADSNQVWLALDVVADGRVIARSGAIDPATGRVDPWSHFINAYLLDRNGNRIDRRNGQDIVTALYDNQIPPGAADTIHYRLRIPEGIKGPVTLEAKLYYRKFDTRYLRYFLEQPEAVNTLPVVTIADDRVTLPVAGGAPVSAGTSSLPEWERWNDYGIGLLRKKEGRQLRQAEQAFSHVERLERAEGALNLARTQIREGRLEEAAEALARAAEGQPPAYPWSLTWFSARIDRQRGELDAALRNLTRLVNTEFSEARRRGFDFSLDIRLLNQLGQVQYERARRLRGNADRAAREALLRKAEGWFRKTLEIDSEDLTAHYGLARIYRQLGQTAEADRHAGEHRRLKPDDNAGDRAIAIHRRNNPAADHAAEAVVIYELR